MSKLKQKYIISSIVIVAVISVVGALVVQHNRNNNLATDKNGQAASATKEVQPPTKDEQAAGNEQKDAIVKGQQATPATPATSANVSITDASQYPDAVEVRALVTNVIRAGTCTITISKGDAVVTKTVQAAADATTTQCAAADFSRDQFQQTGTWNVAVVYTGGDLTGRATGTLEIK